MFGGKWDVAANLPNLSIADYFEYLSARFNLIFNVNEIDKVVETYTLEDVVSNAVDAQDFTSKIDYSESAKINYEYGQYYQKNTLRYAEDENVIKPVGTDSEFFISNRKLPSKGVVYQAPFASCDSRIFQGLRLSNIKKFTSPDNTLPPESEFSPKTRILIYKEVTGGVNLSFGVGTTRNNATLAFQSQNYSVPYFFDAEESYNLGFEFAVKNELSYLVKCLQSLFVASILVRLNLLDFINLRFDTPKIVEVNGEQFMAFLLEVSQFDLSKRTSSELIFFRLKI
jgi:hypothetical protein